MVFELTSSLLCAVVAQERAAQPIAPLVDAAQRDASWMDEAEQRGGPPAPPPGHRPPPEAYEACKGKTEGARCTVEFHDHELAGACAGDPDGALFCLPDEPPPPPPEAWGGPSL